MMARRRDPRDRNDTEVSTAGLTRPADLPNRCPAEIEAAGHRPFSDASGVVR